MVRDGDVVRMDGAAGILAPVARPSQSQGAGTSRTAGNVVSSKSDPGLVSEHRSLRVFRGRQHCALSCDGRGAIGRGLGRLRCAVPERHHDVLVDEASHSMALPLPPDTVLIEILDQEGNTVLWTKSNRPENAALVMREILEALDRHAVPHDAVDYGEVGRAR
jgi:hypothetical protein